MRVLVLGPLEILGGGSSVTAPKQRALLAFLAVNREAPASADRIAEAMWGDDLPKDPRGSVAFHVSKLRSLLGERAIETTATGYRLADDVRTDAAEFEALVAEGRGVALEHPERAVEVLGRALGLWRGRALADVADAEFAQAEIRRLDELRLLAEEVRIGTLLRLGSGADLVPELERTVAANPLREPLVGLLMEALVAAGRPAEALTAYEGCRRRLGSELGVEPSAVLQARYDEVLRLGDTAVANADTRNPFKGLRPFLEGDVSDFFGRESLTDSIVQRVAGGERFLALVGPSGSGKSSLLRAGIVASLRSGSVPGSETWPISVMHPGSHPLEALEAALLRASGEPVAGLADVMESGRRGLARAVKRLTPDTARMVVVVDQFEELYQLATAERRDRFEDLLAEAAADAEVPVVILVGLRADFYDRPLADPDLAALFGIGTVAVPPLGPSDLERAISGPARRVGVTIEPELEARIMTDVLDRPGELPLLQFALSEVFDRRGDHHVGVAEYELVGGVGGALVTTAERLYESFHEPSRATLRSTLLGLVTVRAGGETRRRARVAEIEGPEVEPVLSALDEHRLISFDRDPATGERTVEVAHESLFRAWPRLAAWIDEQRDDLRSRERLAAAALEWRDAKEDPGYLLTGGRLQQLQAWVDGSELAISARDRRFLEISSAAAHEAAQTEAVRAAREEALERRSKTRTRIAGAVAAIAILVGGLAAFAWTERNQAQNLAQEIDRVNVATDFAVASLNTLETDPELGVLYAVEAMRVMGEADGTVLATAVDAAHWAMQAARIEYPDGDAPPLVRAGPGGLRGYFDLPPVDLIDHLLGNVQRRLTPEECAAVAGTACLGTSADLDRDLVVVGRSPIALSADPNRPLAGTVVQVGAVNTGQDEFFAIFEAETGIILERPLIQEDEVEAAARGGILPDAWFLPQPGRLPAYVDAGWLVDVSSYLPRDRLVELYGNDMTRLVTVGPDGRYPADEGFVAGVWADVSFKSLLWYRADVFAAEGYSVPSSWAELISLTTEMIADGFTPWCLRIGTPGDPTAGWLGTDWVEDVLIHSAGPQVYEDWAFHRIPFNSPEVLAAARTFADVVANPDAVYVGEEGIGGLFATSVRDLVLDPPSCLILQMASFAPTLGAWTGVPRDGWDAVGLIPTPADDPAYANTAVISGNVAIAFADRPEVRAFMEWIASPAYGALYVQDQVSLVPSREFDTSLYPTDRQRQIAGWLGEAQAAGGVQFDASDLMPPLIGSGMWLEDEGYFQSARFYDAMMGLIDAPDQLEASFAGVEAAWQTLGTQKGS